MQLNQDTIYQALKTVIDPELGIDIVSLGLIYDVSVTTTQTQTGPEPAVHILMTLTTPGCPLAPVIDEMIRQSVNIFPELDTEQHLHLELTFDPPWHQDMMTEEAKAELDL